MKVENPYRQYKPIDVDVAYQQIDSNREGGCDIRDIHVRCNDHLWFEYYRSIDSALIMFFSDSIDLIASENN